MTPEELQDLGPLLPDTAREIIRVVGLEAAAALITAWPGQEFPVPKHVNANPRGERRYAQLAEIVGEPAALRILAHWGGVDLSIPNCKEAIWARTQDRIRAEFDQLTQDGYSYREAVFDLGIKYQVTSRTIDNVLTRPDSRARAIAEAQAREAAAKAQLGLF